MAINDRPTAGLAALYRAQGTSANWVNQYSFGARWGGDLLMGGSVSHVRLASAMSTPELRCEALGSDRQRELLEHLRNNFFADEPLNHAAGLCRRGEAHPELERHCLQTLAQGMSVAALDAEGKIVGTSLNGLVRRGEREEGERRLGELKDRGFRDILALLYRLNAQLDLFERFDVDELFECRILSVDQSQRGRGIADLLMASSIAEARSRGFKVMKADATGLFSQRVFLKHGFQALAEVAYSEVEDGLRPGPPHQALKLMVKLLD